MKHLFKKSLLIVFLLWQGMQYSYAQVENIHSLTILIDFPDDQGFTPASTFNNMFNQATGYNGFDFNGSVRQYWSDVSNGRLNYTSTIVGWLRASQNRSNYELYSGGGLDMLLAEVLPQIADQQFTGLTLRPGTNQIYSVNVIIEGRRTESLRGVAAWLQTPIRIFNNGVAAFINSTGNATTEDGEGLMSLATILHETGHQAFEWPEHYQAESRIGNLGHFCLMGYGGWDRRTHPVPPNPGLRHRKGWIQNVISLNVNQTTTFTATSNDLNQIFKYTNPNNPREYFLVEPYLKQGRYTVITDEGLAIWYVDEEGGLKLPVTSNAYKVKLIQADGLDQMSTGSYGDANDLFDSLSGKSTFSDFTVPNARWKDGSYSGLHIRDISKIGPTMKFTVEKKPHTVTVTSGANGKISPAGTLRVNSGANQQFQITPDIGYQIDKILVNNSSVTISNPYNVNNITSGRTIHVTFKRNSQSYAPPLPWSTTNFGANVQSEVFYTNNSFHIKSFGDDIWNNQDNFVFEYQQLIGDGEIIARVSEQDATSEWAKAGVMIRESITSNSKHAFMAITPFNGPAFQYRTTSGGSSDNSNTWNARSAIWVKLVRSGNTFTGYYSTNGTSWTLQKSTSIPMNETVYVGLASSAATHLVKKKVVFDNITINRTSLLTKYGVPRSSAIPTGFRQYQYVHTLGTGGPNLAHVFNSVFNWQGNSYNPNGLYQFTLETSIGVPRHYTNIPDYGTYKLHTSSPEITINSSIGFPDLAGSYWVNLHGSNLVLVAKSGAYALYFSNSATKPTREAMDDLSAFLSVEEYESPFKVSPNPFTTSTELSLREGVEKIMISDMSGKLLETIAPGETDNATFTIGDAYPQGMYIIQLVKQDGSEIIKVIKQ